jgi:DNA-binding NarL/FixJ family response regulator
MPISILIADDHPVVRSGIRTELTQYPDFIIVGEAFNGDQAIEMTLNLMPSILFLDVNMPGAKAKKVLQVIKKDCPSCSVIILSAFGDTGTVIEMMKSGASGYILKDEALDALVSAIKAAQNGEIWMSPAISETLSHSIRKDQLLHQNNSILTEREYEVLNKILVGMANQQIALSLGIKERTVEFHITNIFQKLGIKSRVEIILWVKENGMP